MQDYFLPPTKYLAESKGVLMADGTELVVLGEKILYENGPFKVIRRYIKGKHPHLGPLHIGWSKDWETVMDVTVIKARFIVEAKEPENGRSAA